MPHVSAIPMPRLKTIRRPGPAARQVIDFRRSLPPVPSDLHACMIQAFKNVARKHNLGDLTHQSIPRGAEEERIAGGAFLAPRFGANIDPSRLLITNGTQSAVLTLLRGLVGRGGLMLAEHLSYSPVKLLADVAGVQIRGVAIDNDGIIPDSFEDICRTAKPKVLYCNPTVQNPTTAITPQARRVAIADIARRYGVAIIEDEALGLLHADAPQPIAAYAPDITWYVMSTTKCLSHGLRLAFMVAPSYEAATEIIGPVEHLSFWHPAPLSSAMVTNWINTGLAAQITKSIQDECIAREGIAREVLTRFNMESKPGSMHIWLNLPKQWTGTAFMAEAERRGVLLRSAELFAVDDKPVTNSVRMSLSTPETTGDVRRGLELIRDLLEQTP